jgi:hypothetical protein
MAYSDRTKKLKEAINSIDSNFETKSETQESPLLLTWSENGIKLTWKEFSLENNLKWIKKLISTMLPCCKNAIKRAQNAKELSLILYSEITNGRELESKYTITRVEIFSVAYYFKDRPKSLAAQTESYPILDKMMVKFQFERRLKHQVVITAGTEYYLMISNQEEKDQFVMF